MTFCQAQLYLEKQKQTKKHQIVIWITCGRHESRWQNSISEMDINDVYNVRCTEKTQNKTKSVAIGGNHVLFSIILVLELNLPLNKIV